MTPEDAEVAFYVGKVKAEGLGKTPQEANTAGWQEVLDRVREDTSAPAADGNAGCVKATAAPVAEASNAGS